MELAIDLEWKRRKDWKPSHKYRRQFRAWAPSGAERCDDEWGDYPLEREMNSLYDAIFGCIEGALDHVSQSGIIFLEVGS